MAEHRFSFLDVFSDRPLRGNPLAVVHAADGVDDKTMLALARELRLSETSFVQTAAAAGADYRNRIWTIAGEIPLAGHPSLGTAVAVARTEGADRARYVQQTRAGLQPVEVAREGRCWHAAMVQPAAVLGDQASPVEALAAVGLGSAERDPSLPPQWTHPGVVVLVTPVADPRAVARARPDRERLDRLAAGEDLILYLVHVDRERGRCLARGFTGLVPGGEDPATGLAAARLCSYLAARIGLRRIEIAQGAEMRRPSHLVAEAVDDGVRLAGSVVELIEGTLRLPGR